MRDDQIEDLGQYAEQLDAVVQAEQPVAEFWERLLESYCVLSGAKRAILLVTKKAETQWRKAAYHEREAAVVELPLAKFQQLAIKAAECRQACASRSWCGGLGGVASLANR